MTRPKGIAKTGGRKKGTPNKSTLHFNEKLNLLNIDLLQNIKDLLPTLSNEKQVDVLLKLMDFAFPKRKAIEDCDQSGQAPEQKNMHIVFVPPNGREAPDYRFPCLDTTI